MGTYEARPDGYDRVVEDFSLAIVGLGNFRAAALRLRISNVWTDFVVL